ncbi:MAG: hypothetical protein KJ905_01695 [Nanoarchaeota archaeon]|nr:hypothetical protein [Nanoarchaeota archaeon]MBU1501467.1 hypothetical protein [Nanoarchaeota archaeon]MBU2459228.1 hypothetical protein [Nanoarchaeota archaeon]
MVRGDNRGGRSSGSANVELLRQDREKLERRNGGSAATKYNGHESIFTWNGFVGKRVQDAKRKEVEKIIGILESYIYRQGGAEYESESNSYRRAAD